jgi:4-nitrophenyl phosphatase
MDGVLYRGETRLPGVAEILDALTVRGREYMLATNNSMATPESYVAKLARMGIDVPADRILTSALATRDYLLETLPADAGLFVVGMPALREQLFSGTEFRPIQFGEEHPAAVVVGLDLGFSYDKLKQANAAIRAGALFIATNSDATLPTEAGLVPGAGSILASIATATGQTPLVIGKPETPLLVQSLHRLEVPAQESVMIGDRLDTDILAGQRAGMLTVMVLTGVSTREEILHAPVRPDIVVNDLLDLVAAFGTNRPAR